MGPANSRRIPRAPRYSGVGSLSIKRFRIRGFHPLWPDFPAGSATTSRQLGADPITPNTASCDTASVWALPRSLATTCGIIVIFSSCGYLDVSVPRVRPTHPLACGTGIAPCGFPHSDIRASQVICTYARLFAAYHVLRRLREPQASPVRPFLIFLFLAFADLIFSPPHSLARLRDNGEAALDCLSFSCVYSLGAFALTRPAKGKQL